MLWESPEAAEASPLEASWGVVPLVGETELGATAAGVGVHQVEIPATGHLEVALGDM